MYGSCTNSHDRNREKLSRDKMIKKEGNRETERGREGNRMRRRDDHVSAAQPVRARSGFTGIGSRLD